MQIDLTTYLPKQLQKLENCQTELPRVAKNPKLVTLIEQSLRDVPTTHDLYLRDGRRLSVLESDSVHLVLTSPHMGL